MVEPWHKCIDRLRPIGISAVIKFVGRFVPFECSRHTPGPVHKNCITLRWVGDENATDSELAQGNMPVVVGLPGRINKAVACVPYAKILQKAFDEREVSIDRIAEV